MYGTNQPEMPCTDFETLLADALDGALTPDQAAAFETHQQACARCGPLYMEAEAGRRWLAALKDEEISPPLRLTGNILRLTSRAEAPSRQSSRSWWRRVKQVPGLAPVFDLVLQPRFAMSFGMAFFGLAFALTVTGVKIGNLRHADLRPKAVLHNVYETQGKVMKYYENIRVVYEIQSRVQDLKRATTPEEESPKKTTPGHEKDQSEQPDRERYRNYSQDDSRPLLAEKSSKQKATSNKPELLLSAGC